MTKKRQKDPKSAREAEIVLFFATKIINYYHFSLNSSNFFSKLKDFLAKLRKFFSKLKVSENPDTIVAAKWLKKQG